MKQPLLRINIILCYLYIVLSFLAVLVSFDADGSRTTSVAIFAGYASVATCLFSIFTALMYIKSLTKRETLLLLSFTFISLSVLINSLVSYAGREVVMMDVLGPMAFYFTTIVSLRKHVIPQDKLIKWGVTFFVLFCAGVLIFRLFYSPLGAIHAVYFPLFLLPACLLLRRNAIKYLLLAVLVVASILSFKRGAILSSAFVIILFSIYSLRGANFRGKIMNIAIILALFYFGFQYLNSGEENVEVAVNRMEMLSEDGGSGRTDIWNELLTKISNFDISERLLGKGIQATRDNCSDHVTAHNDWIELFFDFGLLSFIPWLLFILFHVRVSVASLINKRTYSIAYFSIIVVYIICTMISHVFFYGYFYSFMMLLAIFKYLKDENRDFNLL